jgi:hypothetical protein
VGNYGREANPCEDVERIVQGAREQSFWFPVNQYYSRVIDFDLEQVSENLRDLGFVPTGKHRDFQINLKEHNDHKFFDALYKLIERISQELEETLL